METGTERVWVQSFFGVKSQLPLVQINWDDLERKISPDEARALALNLLNAAEAAESDAFLADFGVKAMGLATTQIPGLIVAFRAYRESRMQAELDEDEPAESEGGHGRE